MTLKVIGDNGDMIFYKYGSLMPTKKAGWDYNELLPGFVMSQPW